MDTCIEKAKLEKLIKFRKYCKMWRLFSKKIFSKFNYNSEFLNSKNILLTKKTKN